MENVESNLPTKVKVENLKDHFRNTYKLDESQVDLMIKSTTKSMNATLTALYSALDEGSDLKEISRLGHSIKGLFLNMGEKQWAEVARNIELSAEKGEQKDYREIVKGIHEGVEEIL